MNKQISQKILLVNTNLNGFSLANHRRFPKLSHYTVYHINNNQVLRKIKAAVKNDIRNWIQQGLGGDDLW